MMSIGSGFMRKNIEITPGTLFGQGIKGIKGFRIAQISMPYLQKK